MGGSDYLRRDNHRGKSYTFDHAVFGAGAVDLSPLMPELLGLRALVLGFGIFGAGVFQMQTAKKRTC